MLKQRMKLGKFVDYIDVFKLPNIDVFKLPNRSITLRSYRIPEHYQSEFETQI
jgi:hypothetical protein